jgi:hypothetical protein
MVYKIKVTPKHERETQIQLACKTPIEVSAFHEYQNATQPLPVVRLPVELPIYRMANGRTRTEQLKYIRQHKLTPDFFRAGQENQDAQQAQHDLLDRFSKEGTASIIPIATVLAEGRQTDEILLTSAGVVVNGNRRLAAMRELYASGETAYQGFSHLRCRVLPLSVTDKEIKEIEVRLQMQPETKLPYTWVNEALTIKDLMANGFTKDEIMRDMRMQSAHELDMALQALTHAEIYLKEWRKEPEEYDVVEGAKQLFGDMARLLKNKSGDELELSRRLAFLVEDSSKRMGDRAYAFNFSFGKKSAEVADALAARLDVDLTPATAIKGEGDGTLDVDLEDETEGTSYKSLIDILDDSTRRDEIAEELVAVCESIRSAEQDQKRGQAALKAVRDANTKLLEIDIAIADSTTFSAISAQLDSIIARASKLKQEISAASTKPKASATNEPTL